MARRRLTDEELLAKKELLEVELKKIRAKIKSIKDTRKV